MALRRRFGLLNVGEQVRGGNGKWPVDRCPEPSPKQSLTMIVPVRILSQPRTASTSRGRRESGRRRGMVLKTASGKPTRAETGI